MNGRFKQIPWKLDPQNLRTQLATMAVTEAELPQDGRRDGASQAVPSCCGNHIDRCNRM